MKPELKEKYAKIFKLLYALVQQPPNLPEGLSYEQAYQDIYDFTLEHVLAKDLAELKKPWSREELLIVNLKLLDALAENKDATLPPEREALLAEHEKYLLQREKELQAKAERTPSVHQQVQAQIRKLRENLATEVPAIGNQVEILSESLATEFLDNPQQTTKFISLLIEESAKQSGRPISTEKLIEVISPVLTPLVQQNVVLDNFYRTIKLNLPSLPEVAAEKAAFQALAIKVIYPQETSTKIAEWLMLKTESSGLVKFPDQKEIAQVIENFDFQPQGRDLLLQTLTSQGLPTEIATRFVQDKIPETIRFLSSYTPKSDTVIEKEKSKDKVSVLRDLNYLAGYFLESRYNTPFVRYLENVNWQTVYQVYEQAYEVPEARQIYSTSSPNPFVNFVLDQGKGYVQDKVTNLVVDKVAVALGRTASTAATATTATATGAATTTATGTVAAAGTVVNPLVGLVLAIATYVAVKILPKIKHALGGILKKGALLGGGVGALAGFAVGGFPAAIPFGLGGGVAGHVLLSPGGTTTAIQTVGIRASQFFSGMATIAVTQIATPILVIIGCIPIVIALFLYIIQNSAHLVPPSYSGAFGPGGAPYTGPLPEGCPDNRWPLDSGYITQGAWVDRIRYPDTYHSRSEAIDMHATLGTEVKATHMGVVINKVGTGVNAGFGNYVDLLSTCTFEGRAVNIVSRYAHLDSFMAPNNSTIGEGGVIGLSGNSGTVDYHLHYEFRYDHSYFYNTHLEDGLWPYMWPDFIPKEIPRGCARRNTCATDVP